MVVPRKQLLRLWLPLRRLLLQCIKRPRQEEIIAGQVKRVLLIRLDRMGDVILTSAMLPVLKQQFPNADIDYWIQKPYFDLFASDSGFRVITERPEHDYDLVIDPVLDYPLAAARRAASFSAKWTVGFDVAGRGRYFNLPVVPPAQDELFLQSLSRLLQALGDDGELAPPGLNVTALERGNARELTGFDGDYVLIHPGAYYASQRWPEEHVARTMEMLIEKGVNIVVLGAASDLPVIEGVRRLAPASDLLRYYHELPLRVVMALMAEAALVICNNSGPLHLASALGVPTISTLGPTNPHIWWPTGEKQSVLVAENCIHCERSDCNRKCLERIRPEDVVDQIDRLLELD